MKSVAKSTLQASVFLILSGIGFGVFSAGCSDDDVEFAEDAGTVPADSSTGDTGGTAQTSGGHRNSGGSETGGEPTTGGMPSITGGKTTESGGTSQSTGGSPNITGGQIAIPGDCPTPAIYQPPEELRCIGMYSNVAEKKLAPGVREFEPAYKLWSDGAKKKRWIYLPPGTQIDSSAPDDWKMPIGTKLFKEFRWKGVLVETRLFEKQINNVWVKAAYHWNSAETEATRHPGGVVKAAGDDYSIPTGSQCDQCHEGRLDRSLGFDQLLLSLPGAGGFTLQMLIDEGRLSHPPASGTATLGDDGTGKAAAALGYLHVNCGVCCHNGNPGADAYSTGLRLRLPAAAADGRSPSKFESITTSLDKRAETPRWDNKTRVVPGNASQSLLYQLMTLRDPTNPKDRMPPIGSVVVDTEGVKAVHDWIESLPAQ